MFGRGGPFGSMFGNDPFFSDPFSHMDRMMNSMLSAPFFADPLGVGLRPPGPQFIQQVPNARGRQPVIEEVDEAGDTGRTASAQDQPIVEEPDDEPAQQDRASQRQRRHSPQRQPAAQAHAAPMMDPFSQLFGALAGGAMAGGGGSSFVVSSSSYSSMGPSGVSYSASSTTRVGPGGVRETQSVVRDGRSGTESVTISRGLGDGRQRTLVRTRDALTGREEQLEDLRGLSQHEADVFDDQWRHHAERNLPGGGAFGAAVSSGRIGGGGGGRGAAAQQRPLALPAALPAAAPAGHGMYDSNAGFAAAQRAAYARPSSSSGGHNRRPSGGGGGSSHGGGSVYGSGGGVAASRSRGSVLDGQYGTVRQQQQQAYPHSAGASRVPSGGGGGTGYGAGYGAGQGHQRYGY
ncbi:Myeloid leukemia factor 1 [Pleodorina starrii]|uniref:Myeloid leukemia factor 1 n=1 Tax=Pleodorina starrii TaxID=330485 RepID=A0A9W6BHN3_9CHLO|nr:Myeloid leukemia factor 1 [Pleodorina starrii]GLC52352.1 Myeloid leukemia factor 1 [Pleodorina starrii]GLC67980.1 Myeloid leukemia factor 1 [Pleodorina starrii]